MGKFNTFVRTCGKNEPSGTEEIAYMTYISELNGAMPLTKAQVAIAASNTPAAGDTKIYDEAWDFSAAATGEGYWRSMPILINTGSVGNLEEGEIGGKDMTNQGLFFIPGNDAVVKEAVECLRGASGCCIFMLPDKSGRNQVIGSISHPCYFELPEEGGTGGDRVGYPVRAYSMSGAINLEYDAETHGIDITPNP